MTHFYGILKGSRQEVTRTAGKYGGVKSIVASYSGCIVSELYYNNDEKKNCYRILLGKWCGNGPDERIIIEGVFEDEQNQPLKENSFIEFDNYIEKINTKLLMLNKILKEDNKILKKDNNRLKKRIEYIKKVVKEKTMGMINFK